MLLIDNSKTSKYYLLSFLVYTFSLITINFEKNIFQQMIDEQKKQIRKEIKLLKANISFDKKKERSAIIFSKLETNIFF